MFHGPSACRAGGHGVIDMDLLSIIRRWAFRDQLPIREIRRRTGLSQNTIRKYLRFGEITPPVQDAGAAKSAGSVRREAFRLAEVGSP